MSEAADTPRFSQDRKRWATSADRLADRCYREHFDVGDADLYALEALVDAVHDRDAGYRTHQLLDYGGLDRLVDCGDRHVHIAQRWRPVAGGDDLSLRTDNGVPGREAELRKWRTAHEGRGYYPDVIAFGHYEGTLEAFRWFALLDTETVLAALSADRLDPPEHATGDGTAAVYVPVADLRRIGAVIREWERLIAPDSEGGWDG